MTFGIRGNTDKPELAALVLKLARSLDKKKINYLVELSIAKQIKQKFGVNIKSRLIVKEPNLIKTSNYIISIGGDGTFLATAKLVGNRNIPIIGVNLGKLGFLAETSPREIMSFINKLLKGKFMSDERTVLEACSGKSARKIYGVNEIVINQSDIVKTIEIRVYYNNQLVNSYHSDGLILSTPTGSTGYSLSVGGPIVYPKTDVFILSPLSPHTLTARPVILPDSGVFKVKVSSKVPINVIADGNQMLKLKTPATIEIRKAPYTIKIAKSLESNYFKVLTGKLLWGEDKRKTSRF
ncbi:MAG: NAD(+)/NADH kinase [Ignavibacteria bacterium]|nr:NAD(+)/NADH kinase [Ignavibacteria bacterium]